MPIGPDQFAVGFHAGQFARARAGGEDDVLGGDVGNLFAVLGHGDLALAGEFAVADHDGDLVLLHQVLDAAVELAGDAAGALYHRVEIETDPLRFQPEILGMLHEMIELGGPEERLGRDAAPIEADAAQEFALDDRGLHAQLGGADGSGIAAGSAADDNKIELSVAHGCRSTYSSILSGSSISPWKA